jgi:putative ABC transport system permease protein
MPPRLLAFRHIHRLVWHDFMHENVMSFCFVLALATVLAPLLVLFGLKFGLIDTIASRLIEDPRNRELIAVGSGRFDADWFARLRERPEVAFVVPETRRLSASFSWLDNTETGAQVTSVDMVPTGPGDPLLAADPITLTADTEILLSAQTAQRLGVAAGSTVVAAISRLSGASGETVTLPLRVVAVVPEAAQPGNAAFVTPALLVATEDFRDGNGVPRFGWPGAEPPGGERVFPRFRLYARSIYDVAPLRDALVAEGVEVRTRATDIEAMQSLDTNLSRVFWTVAGLAVTGYLASFAASLVAGVERKRRALSILRLIGFPGYGIVAFPLINAALTAAFGIVLAITVYLGVAAGLNAYFVQSLRSGEFICRLPASHLAVAVAATFACALVAAVWAGAKAARLQPAEGVRDV